MTTRKTALLATALTACAASVAVAEVNGGFDPKQLPETKGQGSRIQPDAARRRGRHHSGGRHGGSPSSTSRRAAGFCGEARRRGQCPRPQGPGRRDDPGHVHHQRGERQRGRGRGAGRSARPPRRRRAFDRGLERSSNSYMPARRPERRAARGWHHRPPAAAGSRSSGIDADGGINAPRAGRWLRRQAGTRAGREHDRDRCRQDGAGEPAAFAARPAAPSRWSGAPPPPPPPPPAP